ncbi:MAG: WbqC family protein [Bacteroidetes bacterium]|nr:WbqC family protein [Bacteroidota bacterium]
MNSAIFCLHYLPNIEWYCHFIRFENVILEKHENFVKSSFRNRCDIYGANGRLTLSIPVSGGRDHHRLYTETNVFNGSNWQHVHWNSIVSAYGKAPFFDYYAPQLQEYYLKEWESLFDFNLQLLQQLNTILKIETPITFTESFENEPGNGITDCRNLKPFFLSRYYQSFESRHGFIPNLSILDLLFHEGPLAVNYLSQQKSPA